MKKRYVGLLWGVGVLLLGSGNLNAAVWSNSAIEIPSAAIPAYTSVRLGVVANQIKEVNEFYQNDIIAVNEKKEKTVANIKTLEALIALEIKQITHNQALLLKKESKE